MKEGGKDYQLPPAILFLQCHVYLAEGLTMVICFFFPFIYDAFTNSQSQQNCSPVLVLPSLSYLHTAVSFLVKLTIDSESLENLLVIGSSRCLQLWGMNGKCMSAQDLSTLSMRCAFSYLSRLFFNFWTITRHCMPLCTGHVNIFCIAPILSDVPEKNTSSWLRYLNPVYYNLKSQTSYNFISWHETLLAGFLLQ